MKKNLCRTSVLLSVVLSLLLALSACSDQAKYTLSQSTSSGDIPNETSYDSASDETSSDESFTKFDKDESSEDAVKITLKIDSAEISGSGAAFSDGVLSITSAGTYMLSGELDGSVIISVSKQDKVHLILSGTDIYNDDTSAIYVQSADKVTITLAENTENSLSDGYSYCDDDGAEPSGCLYSKDDLTINGSGSLTVYGNCKNGIVSKDDLKIVSGKITVAAAKNAFKGKDSVVIGGGSITVTGAIDAVKSDNDTDSDKGFILISGGTLTLNCDDDALQAVTAITATGGSITASAKGKTVNCDGTVSIADGILTEK